MANYRKYTKEKLAPLVKESTSITAVVRKLGLNPRSNSHCLISKRVKEAQLDTSHFLGKGSNRGVGHRGGPDKRAWTDILKYGNDERSVKLRRALIESGRSYVCADCKQPPLWQNKRLVLQVHHIDGNRLNNKSDNLEFLCPNCHSVTDNFGIKNRRKWPRRPIGRSRVA